MTITIVGAGMAGLLAANMLHRHRPVVVEAAPDLPNNHTAVLRFRTTSVGDVLGIPFRSVDIIKDNVAWRNPVADALSYSFKNTGKMRSDRSITAGLTVAMRYIAPPDLIERMARGVDIDFSHKCDFKGEGPYISTIPMPALMDALGYTPTCDIQWSPAMNIKGRIKNCDAYVSILVPDPAVPFSRVSITGDELILEVPGRPSMSPELVRECVKMAGYMLGLDGDIEDVGAHPSQYAKILPMDDDERKEFIYMASVKHNVFSLGRFATWRPGLLMDDLVQDVRKIEGWLSGAGRHYAMARGQ